MELKGSQTERNLRAAFAAESQARNRYVCYGDAAKDTGHPDVANIFYELAANEEEHARKDLEFLGFVGDLQRNLEESVAGEHLESEEIYPRFARIAMEEGFTEVGDFFERMTAVEATHEQRCRTILRSLETGEAFRGRPVLHSHTQMAQVTSPNQANPAGFVHGGELMKLIDNAAGVAAVRHSHENVVLVRVADIQFHEPVRVGNLVLLDARLTFVSRTSMEVRVVLEAESTRSGKRRLAVTAHLIMAARERDGQPAEVPPLLISTEAQQRFHDEGKARYEAYKAAR